MKGRAVTEDFLPLRTKGQHLFLALSFDQGVETWGVPPSPALLSGVPDVFPEALAVVASS
jgi:hypothetical protein